VRDQRWEKGGQGDRKDRHIPQQTAAFALRSCSSARSSSVALWVIFSFAGEIAKNMQSEGQYEITS